MTLWIAIGGLAALAAWGLLAPFFTRRAPDPTGVDAAQVLRAQLAELETETAAGRLDAAQSGALRAEIARRLLSEGATPAASAEAARALAPRWAGVAAATMVAVAAIVLYAAVGRPDLTSAPANPATTTAVGAPDADFASLVAQLRTKMREHPGDPTGWRLLGWSLTRLGRFGEAADAYDHAAAREPAGAVANVAQDHSARGEALTQAAGGTVTPAALAAFRAAQARDGADPRARFYLAMARDQAGDHADALAAWTALLKDAPPGAPWLADVRAAVLRIAAKDGEDVSGLPGAPHAAPDAGQGAAIAAMVDGLAARLKADPRDADGWIRLMRARMVLGQGDEAIATLRDALAAFAGAPARQAELRAAAHALNVPGA